MPHAFVVAQLDPRPPVTVFMLEDIPKFPRTQPFALRVNDSELFRQDDTEQEDADVRDEEDEQDHSNGSNDDEDEDADKDDGDKGEANANNIPSSDDRYLFVISPEKPSGLHKGSYFTFASSADLENNILAIEPPWHAAKLEALFVHTSPSICEYVASGSKHAAASFQLGHASFNAFCKSAQVALRRQ
ncbi:hypothetical protein BV25DRAFT_687309 [Artomyces pyxidatus]|uniref:Uncharacterized protein n=1 Tax=Artomyces pyxidatus TaxID=48021 RepID=A0ACB8T0N4_9AGAM|nr:hypothetical protein BV25DRAFT_687309 [Artomyces pyxidatus]